MIFLSWEVLHLAKNSKFCSKRPNADGTRPILLAVKAPKLRFWCQKKEHLIEAYLYSRCSSKHMATAFPSEKKCFRVKLLVVLNFSKLKILFKISFLPKIVGKWVVFQGCAWLYIRALQHNTRNSSGAWWLHFTYICNEALAAKVFRPQKHWDRIFFVRVFLKKLTKNSFKRELSVE